VPKEGKYLSEENNSTDRETIKKGKPNEGAVKKDTASNAQNATETKNIDLFPDGVFSKVAGDFTTGGNKGSNASQDAVDVEEGETTSLIKVVFKYASFFNRIKKNVAFYWNPAPRLYREDPRGKKYLYKNRKTVLFVILDAEGNITDISITKSSEVDFLDQEAVNAFKRCIQFPNPPEGLVKDDKITFYFGFEVTNNNSKVWW
jgi:TonB family protein